MLPTLLDVERAQVRAIAGGGCGGGGRGGGGGSEGEGRGLHSFTLELNLSNSRTHSLVKLGYTVHRTTQFELKSERV
jgi:hypothetical protein